MKYYWFVFFEESLLVERNITGVWSVPYVEMPSVELKTSQTVHTLVDVDGIGCRAVAVDCPPVCATGQALIGLRKTAGLLSEKLYRCAGKAAELIYWDKHSRFCGVCGGTMKWNTPISKRCMTCGTEVWPVVATAIIVLVRRGDEILLVRSHNMLGDYYGLVAGFVETGETLEECVAREVREETGLCIERICYVGSQSWPYPCGLMVGFTADYVAGELHLQQSEIAVGGWFNRSNLPKIPGRESLARQLIDGWLEGKFG